MSDAKTRPHLTKNANILARLNLYHQSKVKFKKAGGETSSKPYVQWNLYGQLCNNS